MLRFSHRAAFSINREYHLVQRDGMVWFGFGREEVGEEDNWLS